MIIQNHNKNVNLKQFDSNKEQNLLPKVMNIVDNELSHKLDMHELTYLNYDLPSEIP